MKNYVSLAPMEKAYRIGLSEASVFPEGPKNKNGGRLSIWKREFGFCPLEKQAATFGEHSFFLALRDKKKGLHSSKGYNLYLQACHPEGKKARDTERGGKCKEKTTRNFAPVGIREFLRATITAQHPEGTE